MIVSLLRALCRTFPELSELFPEPAAPTLLTPEGGSVQTTTRPEFTWTNVSFAYTYTIQIATDPLFTDIVAQSVNQPETSYTPPALPNGTLYWRVQAANIVLGTSPWSVTRSFTVTTVADTPVLLVPAYDVVVPTRTPTLVWEDVSGSLDYDVQVANNEAFTEGLDEHPDVETNGLTLSDLTPGQTYYWRVRSRNPSGHSAYSAPFRFSVRPLPSVPVLLSPPNGSTLTSDSVSGSWTPSSNADSYTLQLASDEAFTEDVETVADLATTGYLFAGLDNATAYYWRVKAVNGVGESAYSDPFIFTTALLPGVPVLVSPAQAQTVTSVDVLLDWNAVALATSYDVQVATNSGMTGGLQEFPGVTDTEQALSGLTPGQTYYWRVRSNGDSGTSSWSGIRSFTILNYAVAPALVGPANNSTINTPTTTLQWSPVPTGTVYNVQYSTVPNFSSNVVSFWNLPGLSQVTNTLQHGVTYYWRARAHNQLGEGAWSAPWSFTVLLVPEIPVLVAPENNYVTPTPTTTLQWAAAANAVSYTVQVASDSNFTQDVQTYAGIAGLTRELDTSASRNYYWRVRAVNAVGNSAYTVARLITRSPLSPVVDFLPTKTGTVTYLPLDEDAGATVSRALHALRAIGRNILLGGDFSALGAWVLNTGWSVANGALVAAGATGTNRARQNNAWMVVGRQYRMTYTIFDYIGGVIRYIAGNSGSGVNRSSNGTFTNDTTAVGTAEVRFNPVGADPVSLKIDNAQVQELDIASNSITAAITGATPGTDLTNNLLRAYYFDGSGDFLNLFTPQFNSAFNPVKGTVLAFIQPDTGTWTDGTLRRVFYAGVDAANNLSIYQNTVDNTLQATLTFGGVQKTIIATGQSFTSMALVGITWNKETDTFSFYLNDTLVGTATGLGTFVGNFASTLVTIGAGSTAGINSWKGLITHFYWGDRDWALAEFQELWNVAQATAAPPPAPTTPSLDTPDDSGFVNTVTPTLTWNAVPNAASYDLQYATDSGFTTGLQTITGIVGTSRQLTGLVDDETYYWRVRAVNVVGASSYSSARSFTVALAASGGLLTWSPPPMTNNHRIVYLNNTNSGQVVRENDLTRDVTVIFTEVIRGQVGFIGGRNWRLIGGHISIPMQSGNPPGITPRTGLKLYDATGTMHIEGLLIDGPDLSEGIQTDTPDAYVQLQNVRVVDVHARDQVGFTDNHPDVVQTYGNAKELRIDRLTGSSDYQGIFVKADFSFPQGPAIIKNCNIRGLPTARYLFWFNNGQGADGPITLENCYCEVHPNRVGQLGRSVWPDIGSGRLILTEGDTVASWGPGEPTITGSVRKGAPPGGDFVKAGEVGVGYVSPGYQ